jgi:hypothetical protein
MHPSAGSGFFLDLPHHRSSARLFSLAIGWSPHHLQLLYASAPIIIVGLVVIEVALQQKTSYRDTLLEAFSYFALIQAIESFFCDALEHVIKTKCHKYFRDIL